MMKSKRNQCIAAIILVILPSLVIISESAIYQFVHAGKDYAQLIVDVCIFLIALLLNKYFFKVKVYPFNNRRPIYQLLNAVPLIILLIFTGKISPLGMPKNFVLAVISVVMVGIAEEYVFRGLLLPILYKLFNNKAFLAIVISSLGFGVMHFINLLNHFPFYFIFAQVLLTAGSGMLYAALYFKTHNLVLPITLHIINDLTIFFPRNVGGNSGTLPASDIPRMLILLVAIFLVCGLIAWIQIRKTKIKF